MNKNFSETQKISNLKEALKDVVISDETVEKSAINRVIADVYEAMREKGYNPVNQIVGYIISGDPTYITSYKDARKKMSRIEQDELLEEFVNYYIHNNL
ncbi:MAG: IreB family regulatory phosphoprotein [Clostridia bacterium]|nr:IreB family regulatory phosphoprotein [Clostridia bacterium]